MSGDRQRLAQARHLYLRRLDVRRALQNLGVSQRQLAAILLVLPLQPALGAQRLLSAGHLQAIAGQYRHLLRVDGLQHRSTARAVDTRCQQIALSAAYLGIGRSGIQFDQHLAHLHHLAITDVDRLDQ
ncbi:hypothetical protein [Pseudomonas sp. AF03-9]|uniref:hypothetical protein n=1 Tax=Pseudomonas sp. AF03-9 TaxID=2849867 RepID=UPI001E465FB4|nr:hypothetical protein [Pseudomonas sp. AF03-9]